jgi:rhamnosyltransferase
MTRKPSIASVTLAYNSAQILPKQLDALSRQSLGLNEIIVVNNGSTDATLGVLSGSYPHVSVLDLPANVGAGGGYAAGLAYAAIEKKHDWVWLLDHDSVPSDDGLESLLRGLDLAGGTGESIGILAPVPVHPETHLSYPGWLWRNGWVRPSAEALCQPTCLVDAVISSGSLIRREAVEKAGLPRTDFFIDFVDFEYCFRLRRLGYEVAMVRDSQMTHAIGVPRTVFKILGYSKAWASNAPWREYYGSRNETITIWNYFPDWRSKFSVLRRLFRHAAGVVAFGEHKRACLKMMLFGFLDGRAGRTGIRFLPSEGQQSQIATLPESTKSVASRASF